MLFRGLPALLLSTLLLGCASSGDVNDPWEGFNRFSYKVTKVVDEAVVKPVAKGYKAVMPDVAEQGVSNLFSNLGDVSSSVNNLLQGKVVDSFSDLGRLAINSTLGLGGLFDFASEMGFEKHDEDFGQTIAVWGVGSGPFVWVPFWGPTTLRDGIVFPANSRLKPTSYMDHVSTRNQLLLLKRIDARAAILKYDEQLKEALDEYAFVRELYLQNRNYKVLDGDIPFEDEECEDEEEEDCDF